MKRKEIGLYYKNSTISEIKAHYYALKRILISLEEKARKTPHINNVRVSYIQIEKTLDDMREKLK